MDNRGDVFLHTVDLSRIFLLQGLDLIIGLLLVLQLVHLSLLQLKLSGTFLDLYRLKLLNELLVVELALSDNVLEPLYLQGILAFVRLEFSFKLFADL